MASKMKAKSKAFSAEKPLGKNEIVKFKGLFSHINNDWKTPKRFYEELNKEFHFGFDPCPNNPSFDGLNISWGIVNFVNPPYNDIEKWCKKAYGEWQKGETIVMLIPSRTDTRWWHEYIMKADEIRFVKGRLKFNDGKGSAPFPSAVIVFRGTSK